MDLLAYAVVAVVTALTVLALAGVACRLLGLRFGIVRTLLAGIIAFVLVKQGQARIKRATPPVPEQTIETVKEDVEWAKTQMRSDKT